MESQLIPTTPANGPAWSAAGALSSYRKATAARSGLAQAWAAWWLAVRTRRASRQAVMAVHHLDAHVLRDIGAPEWLLRESEATRQLEHHRRAHWLWT